MVKTDITQMTAQEIEDYLRQKKDEATKLLQQNAAKWKEELEAHCQKKYGVSLGTIFTASGKSPKPPSQYKHPTTGETFVSGKGKKRPAWLKGKETEYEVKSN